MDHKAIAGAALGVLVAVSIWQTDRFQRWVNPTGFYEREIREIQENIAMGRAFVRQFEEEIAALDREARIEPEEFEFYQSMKRDVEESIVAEREMIAWDIETLEAAKAALSEIRRYP